MVAADIDVTVLERLDLPGVEVRRVDLTADELPAAGFDFVHTRLVLLHVPEREQILRRLATALRPGGVLMVEEDDTLRLAATASDAYRVAWGAFMRTMRRAGVDGEWARRLWFYGPAKIIARGRRC